MATAEQKALLEAAGVDLASVNWQKVIAMIQAILAAIGPLLPTLPQGMQGLEHCDHKGCCAQVACLTGQAFEAALCHLQKCCCEE